MKKFIIIPLFMSVIITLSSCATIFTGTEQSIQINSSPKGAIVEVQPQIQKRSQPYDPLYSEDTVKIETKTNYIERGTTPISLNFDKSNTGRIIRLSKEGYEPENFQLRTTFNAVSILNFLTPLFWSIDVATGALWKYDPSFYDIKLEEKSENK